MPIGGAEERVRNRIVLRRFVEICGGSAARIVIVPTASKLESTGPDYEAVFLDLGAEQARSIDVKERTDCRDEQWIEAVEGATGVFFTGGNQLRLSTILGGDAACEVHPTTVP